MPTNRRRRKEDEGISPFMDPAFRRSSIYFDDIEYQRRFEQNLIRYDLKNGGQITQEINNTIVQGGGGGGGGADVDDFCLWTLEGSNIVRYGGNVGVGVHPHDNDFEVRGNVLVEAIAEQPYVEIRNWSDTEYDPVIHWSVGATPIKKFTMGVDDSDSDAWLLCSGDVLTSLVADAIYELTYNYSGKILIADTSNHRVHVYLTSGTRAVSAGTGSAGSGDNEFSSPWAVCNDGIYAYILETGNDRLQKRLLSDLSFVAKIGSLGAGNDQFSNPAGICTDGIYLYIADTGNNRIQKRLCSDLSYVSSATDADPTHSIIGPDAICTDGTYVYFVQTSGATCRLVKLQCSNLVSVLQIHDDGYLDGTTLGGICVRGGFLYITNTNNPATLLSIYKYTASSFTYVSHYVAGGSVVHTEAYQLSCIDTDGTYLYVFNRHTAAGNPQEIQIRTLAGVWVSEFGTYGTAIGNFFAARGVSLCGTISAGTTTPYRAPILKAGVDGSYVDAYPLLRARDGFQLMEDGTVAATKYVGLYAPAAITASYSLTFPGTGPAAIGHFAVSAAGAITFGQNVGTTGSPTFVRLTLSQAVGTALMTITSTTVVANLNVDQVDGKHEGAFVLIDGTRALTASWDVGSFEVRAQTFQSDVATGTAPFTVASTTAVTNLNADLLDGSHAAAFAAAGHDHSGVYEPALGNPGTDGYGLVSTALGVRSWASLLSTSFLGLGSLADPNADRMMFWDDSEGALKWLACGNSAAITGATLDTIQDIRTTANPLFQGLTIDGPRLAGWSHRKLFALPIPTANLTDFPAKVPIVGGTPESIAIGAACRADGYDIRFTAADGVTLLKYERESFAVAGGEASGIFWVKTNVTTTGTHIWLYYGNPAASDGQNATAVWDANFKAVYHMNDATTSTILDSTGNDNDGAKLGANQPIEAAGKIAKGQDFDGADDRVVIADNATLDRASTDPLSLSLWIYANSLTGERPFLCKGDGNVAYNYHLYTTDGILTLGGGSGASCGFTPSAGVWQHLEMAFDGADMLWYSNGSLVGTSATVVIGGAGNKPLYIGNNNVGGQYFDGIIDEVRVSSIARFAAWIAYEYANMNPADGGLTWGAEETLFLDVDADVDVTGVYRVDGIQVLKEQQAAIADPTGGLMVDVECRAQLALALAMLRTHGLISV